ncbi:MAG: hypothetical protein AABX77_02610 [Nanoarchaeota archaeon]
MIPPQYSWAYGRITRDIRDKLKENFGDSLTIIIECPSYSDGIDIDLVRYIIKVSNKNRNLGEIKVSNRESVKISLDKSLEDITNILESVYSQDKLKSKLNSYLDEYSKLIDVETNILKKLSYGTQLSNYPKLEEAIGIKLAKEITNIENLRLNPLFNSNLEDVIDS